MRNLIVSTSMTLLLAGCACASAEDLDDSIREHLSPATFQPSLVDENTVIRVIKSHGSHIILGGLEIRRVYAQAARRGIEFQIDDLKIQHQATAGSVVSVVVQARITQKFKDERVTKESVLHEEWQRRPFGWVLLSGVVEELPTQ